MYNLARPTNDNQCLPAARDPEVSRSGAPALAQGSGPVVLHYVADGSFIVARRVIS
jgi:hypothetical protein